MLKYCVWYEFSNGSIYHDLTFKQVKNIFLKLMKEVKRYNGKYINDFKFFNVSVQNEKGMRSSNETLFTPGYIKYLYHIRQAYLRQLKKERPYTKNDIISPGFCVPRNTEKAFCKMFYNAAMDIENILKNKNNNCF